MRCGCCNRLLNSFESTRKSATSGEYLDMCNKCYSSVSDSFDDVDERTDLDASEVPDEELVFDDVYLEDMGDDEWQDSSD